MLVHLLVCSRSLAPRPITRLKCIPPYSQRTARAWSGDRDVDLWASLRFSCPINIRPRRNLPVSLLFSLSRRHSHCLLTLIMSGNHPAMVMVSYLERVGVR